MCGEKTGTRYIQFLLLGIYIVVISNKPVSAPTDTADAGRETGSHPGHPATKYPDLQQHDPSTAHRTVRYPSESAATLLICDLKKYQTHEECVSDQGEASAEHPDCLQQIYG